MTQTNKSSKSPNLTRKWLVSAALAGGVAVGAAGIAGAVSTPSTSAAKTGATAATGSQGNEDATHEKAETAAEEAAEKAAKGHGGHGDHGGNETVVTGSDADKANAAALVAVPGKVIKTEKRDDGTFEVEVTKADGSEVHVHLDKLFKVTDTNAGGRHRGHHGDGNHGGKEDDSDTTGGAAN